MSQKLLENPFPVTTYQGAEYFCNRTSETALLKSHMINGNSTTLIAKRRLGKTGLIQHVLSQLPEGWKGIYIDILETEDMNHFLNIFTTSVIKIIPEKGNLGKVFGNFIKSLRPVISYDSLTGAPLASFDLKPKEAETNINSVLLFLEKQNFKVVIAIDEFQQILNYPQKNADAWFRARIQQLKNVVFIFSGSQQHLMTDLFTSPKRPFFRSTQIMRLDKLNRADYSNFIVSMFGKYKKKISTEIANEILDWANVYTFYVQQICNRVFAVTPKEVTSEIWKNQAYLLLKEQESVFFAFRNLLTHAQWQLLKAIANEGEVCQPTSKAFLNKYHLGTSATVLRSLGTLQNYELVYDETNSQGVRFYSVYDVFFQKWTQENEKNLLSLQSRTPFA